MRPSTIGSECDFLDNRWLWPRKAGATICAITLPPTPGERGHRVLAYRRVAERPRAIFRGLLLTGPTRRRRLSSITRAPCRKMGRAGPGDHTVARHFAGITGTNRCDDRSIARSTYAPHRNLGIGLHHIPGASGFPGRAPAAGG